MTEHRPNRLVRSLKSIDKLPKGLRTWARSKAIGRVVKFVGTAGIRVDDLGPDGGTFFLKNRNRVQNHIGGIHAMATGLLLETATGLALGVHLPDQKVPLLKSIEIRYKSVAKGDLTAHAWLTPDQIEKVKRDPKGDIQVNVDLRDSAEQQPVDSVVSWAWISRNSSL